MLDDVLFKFKLETILRIQISTHGTTPLIQAILMNKLQMALFILQTNRYDPGYVDKHGMTALLYLCEYDDTIYNNADRNKRLQLVKAILVTGESNLNHGDNSPIGMIIGEDRTALMLACIHKLSDIAMAILSTKGINLDQIDSNGYTALMYADLYELPEVLSTILVLKNKNTKELLLEKSKSDLVKLADLNKIKIKSKDTKDEIVQKMIAGNIKVMFD